MMRADTSEYRSRFMVVPAAVGATSEIALLLAGRA
jgi:hypothetical protein